MSATAPHAAPPHPLRVTDWLLGVAMVLPAIPVGLWAASARHGLADRAAAVPVSLVPIAGYAAILLLAGLAVPRLRRDFGSLALYGAWVIACVAVAIHVTWVESLVRYPADILTWSEGPFVQDIVRFRAGLPLYSDPGALESFFYPPLTQLATYLVAGLVGAPLDIAVYRTIQLGWIALASGLVVLIVAELRALDPRRGPEIFPDRHPRLGSAFIAAMAFLVGTNPITSPFAHNLHNDSLAVLVCTLAFWLLLRYARTRSLAPLVMLALIAPVGFLVKQSLAVWAPLLTVAIALLGGDRWFRRAAVFGVASLGGVAAAAAGGGLLWGSGWSYWVFSALANHGTSLLRAVQHAMDVWLLLGLGLAGGLVLLRDGSQRPLMVAWLVWLGLFASEVITSGIAWMLNHMAPGSMLAAAWALAAIVASWDRVIAAPGDGLLPWLLRTTRAAGWCGAMVLLVAAMTAGRMPVDGLPVDAERYRLAIEAEVRAGLDADAPVLLDHGSWIFAPLGQSVGDRSAAVGELGISALSDFADFLARIRERHYGRILVRDYDAPILAYDHASWPRPSGIKQALDANYRIVARIPAVVDGKANPWFGAVTVLEPRPDH